MRSPTVTGLEYPRREASSSNDVSVDDHSTGSPFSAVTPCPPGPRNCRQSAAAAPTVPTEHSSQARQTTRQCRTSALARCRLGMKFAAASFGLDRLFATHKARRPRYRCCEKTAVILPAGPGPAPRADYV